MRKRNFTGSINGKGYYIALILCAAAIGISGYLYYRNVNQEELSLQNDPAATDALSPGHSEDIQAVATQPGETAAPSKPAQTEPAKAGKPSKRTAPVSGETVAGYAMDVLSYNQTTRDWRVHNGVDIAAEAGTAVVAAADGTVYTVYEDETMGTTVVIRHDGGYVTKYASLEKEVAVAPGDTVTVGQTIGTVGATAMLETAIGPHVHFSVTCDGEDVDPAAFLE